jgi:predicted hydrolase (HD superfamily)
MICMIEYNAQTGKELMQKYLGEPKLSKRLEHSLAVGDFSSKVAGKIKQRNPELDFDADLCEFLGYSHDIGYSVKAGKHEVHTIDILQKEGVDPQIAKKAMHGQLIEQFGIKENNVEQYTPSGVEGMILTYCDMSVRSGELVTIRERAEEIVERVKSIPMPEELKKDIEVNLHKALPRFERYEKIVLALAGVNSAKEF